VPARKTCLGTVAGEIARFLRGLCSYSRFCGPAAYLIRGMSASRALNDVIVVRCLRCGHEANLSHPALVRFGLNPDAPISTFVKRLRCSKCGSGSVMAKRITQATAAQDQRKRRA
jgi:hypothetical protein